VAKQQTARGRAREYAARAKAALIDRGLRPAITVTPRRFQGREHWETRNAGPISIPPQLAPGPGRWHLHLRWIVEPDPAGGEPLLVESSLGLHLAPPLTEGAESCFVRYDIDHRASAPTAGISAAHLNVLQPGRVLDKVHYALPGVRLNEWPLEEVLALFLSSRLREDLHGRLP
jgi:hypothetical protein